MLALGGALAALGRGRPARADDAPKSHTHEYSSYEVETIDAALAKTKREIDLHPEGKIIEGYDVIALDVFEKRDPVPTVFNVFHFTSKPYTISRELLIREGEPYRKVLVDETARNLRKLSAQLSLVLIVPVRGTKPGTVRLLLITKDVWSLRLNSNFSFVAGRFEHLFISPSEQNVLGTHHVASTHFYWQPISYALGGYYKVPWVAGTRVQASGDASMIINHQDGRVEGSEGTLLVQRPLYATQTPWAVAGQLDWKNDVARRYTNGQLGTFNARATPEIDLIPWQYRRIETVATAQVVRSFGWASKHDVYLGFEGSRRSYRTYDMSPFAPIAAQEFIDRVIPVGENRVGPYAQYRHYRTDYLRVLDVEILGLQEDFALGLDFLVKVYPIVKALGSTRDVLGSNVGLQYTQKIHDGFIRASAETIVESQTDRITDANLEWRLRVVSPRTGLGRLVFDGWLLHRFRNYLNRVTFLGGESLPRGYPTRFLFGPNVAAYTMEFRTRPLEILKTMWGLVAFADAGDAYEGVSDLRLNYSVGGGIRALFPQFDRVSFRADIGFPVQPGGLPPGVSTFATIFTVGQAFELRTISR